jgi:hypothetical protein
MKKPLEEVQQGTTFSMSLRDYTMWKIKQGDKYNCQTRLMGRRDLAWVSGFPGLGINTTLVCLQLIGMYPNGKLALSSIELFPPSISKPCSGLMGIIPSMPGDLYG